MSEKYIIEYTPGCRGDFLCNFLNYNELFLSDKKSSMSKSIGLNLKKISQDSFVNKKSPTIEELYSLLNKIENLFTPSHSMTFFGKECFDLIKEKNFKIIKIKIDKDYYKNVWIENTFKTQVFSISNNQDNFNFKNDFEKIDYIDTRLTPQNSSYTFLFDTYNKLGNEDKYIINYEDLYFNIKIDKFFPNIDLNLYKNFLKKAELKKEIEIWGKKYYPADYGYIWNKNL
jgi:hypothetical protein